MIGLFNAETLLVPGGEIPIANFALAGNVLVIEANERMWSLELAETVVMGHGLFLRKNMKGTKCIAKML